MLLTRDGGDPAAPGRPTSSRVRPVGAHVDATPRVAATDGGEILEAGDDGEVLTDDDGRPGDCDCGGWNADTDLPCWPCYRDGFDAPNPDAPADDE